jgi:spore coat protein H
MLHMLSAGAAVLMWANYNDAGDPIWMIASGRARDRVLHFEDFYHSHVADGETLIQRVGRGSIAFVADPSRPGCSSAVLRFHVDGDGFAANDGRQLHFLDGLSDCADGPEHMPLLRGLEGSWFDPDQSGQGLSLMPIAGNALWLNWYGYDDQGRQIWQAGAGWPTPEGDRIVFEPLYTVSGGNFNDFMGPDDLSIEFLAPAELAWIDGQWQFESSWQGEEVLLRLHPIQAGPDLLASTGNRFDLILDPADLDELYSRPIWSDERLPGQVRFNGEDSVHELTGLRFRGSSSRRMPKKSFNIRFENPQQLVFGSDRMNLNAMYTDPSMMREALSFKMFKQLGQPAPETRHFDLWINDIYEGTYIHIQRVDETLLTMSGLDPDGTLVRDDVRGNPAIEGNSIFSVDLSDLDAQERMELVSEAMDFRGTPNWQAVAELVSWVQETPPGPAFHSGLEARFDLENFIDWLAIHWLIGDIDSFGDDYWLYLDHNDSGGRWIIIPWDKDLSFGSHWRGQGFDVANDWFAYEYNLTTAQQPGNLLVARFMSTPSLRQAAESRLIELIEGEFSEDWFKHQIEALSERLSDSASITPGPQAFVRHPRNHHSAIDRYQDHVETVAEFVQLRQNFLRTRVLGGSGDIDSASSFIPTGTIEPINLVDSSGATLMRLDLTSPSGTDVHLQVEVVEDSSLRGINRQWLLTVDGELPVTELTLFYRNDISNAWGRGNWWTEGEEPIGQQAQLVMEVSGPNGWTETLPTRINPIANKAVAELELGPGNYQLRLQLP